MRLPQVPKITPAVNRTTPIVSSAKATGGRLSDEIPQLAIDLLSLLLNSPQSLRSRRLLLVDPLVERVQLLLVVLDRVLEALDALSKFHVIPRTESDCRPNSPAAKAHRPRYRPNGHGLRALHQPIHGAPDPPPGPMCEGCGR
jgi:hypothetical protein